MVRQLVFSLLSLSALCQGVWLLPERRGTHPHPHPHPHPSPSSNPTPVSTVYTTTTYNGNTTKSYTTGPPNMPTVVVELPCTDPTGWNWAHYNSTYLSSQNGGKVEAPESFKNKKPDDVGVTPTIGGFMKYGGNDTFYQSSKSVNAEGYGLNHHTYLKVPVTGTYTFNVTKGDGAAWVWVGQNAYSGWTGQNNNTGSYYNSGYVNDQPYQIRLSMGDYVPVRVFLDNEADGGPSSFDFQVTEPDGSIVPAEDFKQYGCATAANAPAFQPFGSES